MPACYKCARDETGVFRILKCPECYKYMCEECAVRLYGRYFCSNVCATNFFFIVDDI